MRTLNRITAAASMALACAGAQAADIAWSLGPTFNGPSGHLGILINGTLIEAANLTGGSGGAQTVDPGGLNITFTAVNSPFFGNIFGGAGTGGNSDLAWGSILNTFEWQSGADVDGVGFLSGLTSGHQYQVQFFAARSDCCGSRTATFGDGAGNLSTPVRGDSYTSVVGTFIADGTAQTIEFFDSTSNPILNAYVLRDITPVPEPTTVALMLAGVLGVAGAVRRRRNLPD
jgi:PEP-CTERM motif